MEASSILNKISSRNLLNSKDIKSVRFSTIKVEKSKETDIEQKIDGCEKKLENLFERNFDVFNGYYFIKTPFQKIYRPPKKTIKLGGGSVQREIDLDRTMERLKRAINSNCNIGFISNIKKTKLSSSNEIPKTEKSDINVEKYKLTNKNSCNSIFGKKKELQSIKLSRNYKSMATNLNSINTLQIEETDEKDNKKETLPNIKSTQRQTFFNNTNSLPSPLYNSELNYKFSNVSSPKNAYNHNKTKSSLYNNNFNTRHTSKILSHKSTMGIFMKTFTNQENECKFVSDKIQSFKNERMSIDPEIFKDDKIYDNVELKNLFEKDKQIIIFKRHNKNVIMTEDIKKLNLDLKNITTDRKSIDNKISYLIENNDVLNFKINKKLDRIYNKLKEKI